MNCSCSNVRIAAEPSGCRLYLPHHNITAIQWFSQFSGFNATRLGHRVCHGNIWCVLPLMGFCMSHLRLPCNAGSRCRASRGSRAHSRMEGGGEETKGVKGSPVDAPGPINRENERSAVERKRQRSANKKDNNVISVITHSGDGEK